MQQRKIREVLVIDGVVLAALDEARQAGELQRQRPPIIQQHRQTADEVPQVRNVGQDIVGRDEIGGSVALHQLSGGGLAEETHLGPDPARLGGGGNVGGRLDPEDRDVRFHEMLKEISVVARDLDHKAMRSQVQDRLVIRSAYRRACSTQEVEYDE